MRKLSKMRAGIKKILKNSWEKAKTLPNFEEIKEDLIKNRRKLQKLALLVEGDGENPREEEVAEMANLKFKIRYLCQTPKQKASHLSQKRQRFSRMSQGQLKRRAETNRSYRKRQVENITLQYMSKRTGLKVREISKESYEDWKANLKFKRGIKEHEKNKSSKTKDCIKQVAA